jgi:hypothetical protein
MLEAGNQATALAKAGAESMRGLTYAAAVDMFPQDVRRVLTGLHAMTGHLPHLLGQLDTTLARQLHAQGPAVSDGTHVGDPSTAVSHPHEALELAASIAEQLADLLAKAQNALDFPQTTATTRRSDTHPTSPGAQGAPVIQPALSTAAD